MGARLFDSGDRSARRLGTLRDLGALAPGGQGPDGPRLRARQAQERPPDDVTPPGHERHAGISFRENDRLLQRSDEGGLRQRRPLGRREAVEAANRNFPASERACDRRRLRLAPPVPSDEPGADELPDRPGRGFPVSPRKDGVGVGAQEQIDRPLPALRGAEAIRERRVVLDPGGGQDLPDRAQGAVARPGGFDERGLPFFQGRERRARVFARRLHL